MRVWRLCLRLGIATSSILVPVVVMGAAPAEAGTGIAAAAANKGLTITSSTDTLSTLSGSLTFAAAAPGCTGTANSIVVTLTGTGVPPGNADGSKNITGSVPATPGTALSTDSGGLSWDGIARANSVPRPLSGTFTVKLQCLEDGDTTGQAFFDSDVTFTRTGTDAPGQPGTWQLAGSSTGATPTPTPSASPTPTPTATPNPSTTPTPGPSDKATPTPEPDADKCVTDEAIAKTKATDECSDAKVDEADNTSGDLPGTGGNGSNKPTGLVALAVLLFIAGLLFLALAVEPRSTSEDDWDERA